jgi:hypothetical protein
VRSIPYAILCRCHALFPLALSERQLAIALSLEGYRIAKPLLRKILANLRKRRQLELIDGDGRGLCYRLRPAGETEDFFAEEVPGD